VEASVDEQKCKNHIVRERKKVAKEESIKPLPYPLTPSKNAKESYFAKFLKIFKKLEIKIPFGDALQQIPLYAKFMKELLTKKRKNNEVRGNCSAIIQNVLPPKSRILEASQSHVPFMISLLGRPSLMREQSSN